MSIPSALLAANADYAASFTHGDLPAPPARQVAIVTCMDARLDPAKFLGLNEGEAHVIRNAGGRVSDDVIRSLVISQQELGTREVAIIHHTKCGMLNLDTAGLQAKVRERLGADASGIDFLPFGDLRQSVRDDVAAIRNSPYIPRDIGVSGFIYDVQTGRLERLV